MVSRFGAAKRALAPQNSHRYTRYTPPVSKRLQVVMDDDEWAEISRTAREQGVTVSQWVRATLRTARSQRATGDGPRKLGAIRAAARHAFPSGDIEQMLGEIEQGYR